ncbi:MAG TPA: hypothetical protein VMU98_08915 [Acidimicrobiales bacterium]|nr:hypothetical protein [Acidimicrobiales bacterium]
MPPEHDADDESPNYEVGEMVCYAGLLCPDCQIVLDGSAHRVDCALARANGLPTNTAW